MCTDRRKIAAIAVAMMMLAGVARAGDGRLEISQSCVATGCFAGDAPGFPVETEAGKSYVLTSSLTVPDANTIGVTLADRAVLDLNGFEIAGPTACAGAPASCTGTGTGIGVYAQDHSTIRGGAIRGMGRYGIGAEVGVTVEDMLVEGNGDHGIFLNYGPDGPEAHLIRRTRVVGNGGNGILNSAGFGGIGSLVTDCVIHGNEQAGIGAIRTQITNTVISRNGSFGVSGSSYGLGHSTVIFNNGGNDQAQTSGTFFTLGTNVCGTDTTCP